MPQSLAHDCCLVRSLRLINFGSALACHFGTERGRFGLSGCTPSGRAPCNTPDWITADARSSASRGPTRCRIRKNVPNCFRSHACGCIFSSRSRTCRGISSCRSAARPIFHNRTSKSRSFASGTWQGECAPRAAHHPSQVVVTDEMAVAALCSPRFHRTRHGRLLSNVQPGSRYSIALASSRAPSA